MRQALVLAVVASIGCGRHRPMPDHVIEDFRVVTRSCLHELDGLVHQHAINLIDDWELADAVTHAVLVPWKVLRARVEIAPVPEGSRELYALVGHYLREREEGLGAYQRAWFAQSKTEADELFTTARVHDDAAAKDLPLIEAKLHDAPPLPALVPDAGVVFHAPPSAPPGSAFFLVDDGTIVLLDDRGFRVIANNMESMDVLPDGTMWACGGRRAVHWDGKAATEIATKIATSACAAGPDGKLWVVDNDLEHHLRRLASFDGATWTLATSPTSHGDDHRMVVDRDQTIFVGGDVWTGETWTPIRFANDNMWQIDHLFRGDDGHVYAFYGLQTPDHRAPTALARVRGPRADPPLFVDRELQQGFFVGAIDRDGLATLVDARHNRILQGGIERQLPQAVIWRPGGLDRGPFAFDAGDRMWLSLADGLSVIDRDEHRTIYPHGSIPGIGGEIDHLVVVGAGPTLPPPHPAEVRTITGTVAFNGKPLANVPVIACDGFVDGNVEPCARAIARWETTTDAAGHFTFATPKYMYTLMVRTEPPPHPYWKTIYVRCCDRDADLAPADVGPTSP